MNSNQIRKLSFTAMCAALCALTTMLIKIPSPIGGYLHLGEAFVLLSGFLLGPFYGAAAAGIGSAFADILSGYIVYAPATFVIKAAVAFFSAKLLRACWSTKKSYTPFIISCAVGVSIMTGGYLFFSAIFLHLGAGALLEVPGNLVQGIIGSIISIWIYAAVQKTPFKHQINLD